MVARKRCHPSATTTMADRLITICDLQDQTLLDKQDANLKTKQNNDLTAFGFLSDETLASVNVSRTYHHPTTNTLKYIPIQQWYNFSSSMRRRNSPFPLLVWELYRNYVVLCFVKKFRYEANILSHLTL